MSNQNIFEVYGKLCWQRNIINAQINQIEAEFIKQQQSQQDQEDQQTEEPDTSKEDLDGETAK